jgi:hypothetical protein
MTIWSTSHRDLTKNEARGVIKSYATFMSPSF